MPEFLDPNQVLNQIKLDKEMTVADFGSGAGGWVIPLAKKIEDGLVYAVDVLEAPLSVLKSRASNLKNIRTIRADVEEGIKDIPDKSCDWVLMTNLLFQIEDKEAVLKEAKRVLKDNSFLLVVDWKEDSQTGPKTRVKRDEIRQIIKNAGFQLEKELNVSDHHFFMIFKKT